MSYYRSTKLFLQNTHICTSTIRHWPWPIRPYGERRCRCWLWLSIYPIMNGYAICGMAASTNRWYQPNRRKWRHRWWPCFHTLITLQCMLWRCSFRNWKWLSLHIVANCCRHRFAVAFSRFLLLYRVAVVLLLTMPFCWLDGWHVCLYGHDKGHFELTRRHYVAIGPRVVEQQQRIYMAIIKMYRIHKTLTMVSLGVLSILMLPCNVDDGNFVHSVVIVHDWAQSGE